MLHHISFHSFRLGHTSYHFVLALRLVSALSFVLNEWSGVELGGARP